MTSCIASLFRCGSKTPTMHPLFASCTIGTAVHTLTTPRAWTLQLQQTTQVKSFSVMTLALEPVPCQQLHILQVKPTGWSAWQTTSSTRITPHLQLMPSSCQLFKWFQCRRINGHLPNPQLKQRTSRVRTLLRLISMRSGRVVELELAQRCSCTCQVYSWMHSQIPIWKFIHRNTC